VLVSEKSTAGVWHLRVFGTTVKEVGSLPGPSRRPVLPSETVITVCRFYESDNISHIMPGKKDFVSVKKERKREHIQSGPE